jgi:hypothetical protein
MKKFLTKSVFVIVVFIAINAFRSCDSFPSKKGNKTLIVADISIPVSKKSKKIAYQKPIVFIAGFDKGTETFYSNARTYFKEKGLHVIEGKYSLEKIIVWLNKNGNQLTFSDIHTVNKSNPYRGMNL